MNDYVEALRRSFHEGVYKCVISKPADPGIPFKKIELELLDGVYQITKYTETQVFHEKMRFGEAERFIERMFGHEYKNLNSWSADEEYSLQISKKGKLLSHSLPIQPGQAPEMRVSHNREKNYLFKQGAYIEPLMDMGIFTKEGQVVHSMYDKYKQINRFVEIVDDEIKKIDQKELTILDFGCGKSYLTFLFYYYFTEIKKTKVNMTGLDLKAGVVAKCNAAARKYGYDNLMFKTGDVGNYQFESRADMVITLHACDTATDFALYNAICGGVDMIFSVPCCQHELNRQIKSDRFALLTRHGIIKDRLASLITDAIRCNLLECCGYKTQMVEFVAFDHTPKNIMIRAIRKAGQNKSLELARLAEVESLMEEFQLDPALYRLLKGAGRI